MRFLFTLTLIAFSFISFSQNRGYDTSKDGDANLTEEEAADKKRKKAEELAIGAPNIKVDTLETVNSDSSIISIFNWDPNPKLHLLTEKEKNEASVVILEERKRDYYGVDDYKETVHKIIAVNNDLGVKKHNRVYLSIPSLHEISEIKVRVIKKNGDILYMDRSNLKQLENLDGYGGFVIFAIEGIEKGGEIEYIYKIRKNFQSCGRLSLQVSSPIRMQAVKINYVKEFTAYAYHSNPDSTISTDLGFEIVNYDVPKFEVYESDDFKKRLDYKFSRFDTERGYYNLFENTIFYRNVENEFQGDKELNIIANKYTKRAFKKIAKQDPNKFIALVISSLNKEFKIVNQKVTNRIKSKSMTEKDLVICLSIALRNVKIPNGVCIIGNRFTNEINRDFLTYFDIDDFILYLPIQKKFIDPNCEFCGVNRIPFRYIDSDVVQIFERRTKNNDILYYTNHQVKKTDLPTAKYSTQTTNYDVQFNDESGVEYQLNQTRTGYYANGPISYIDYFNSTGAKYEEYVKDEIQYYGDQPVATSPIMKKVSMDTVTISGKLEDEQLAQYAGNRIIFNLGKMIGNQTEMYDSIPHAYPQLIRYPKTYKYKMKIEIPEGYEVLSSNNINLHKIAVSGTDTLCEWTSSYKVVDNYIEVNITEYYNEVRYEVKDIPIYRDVINAAANFNQGVIIFKKKG